MGPSGFVQAPAGLTAAPVLANVAGGVDAPSPLPSADAVIVGVGARTASGLTALQATMSARALKLDPRPSHMIDHAGEPIATARLRSIGDNVFGIDRFLALAGPALAQAAFPWLTAQHARTRTTPRLPLVVALPSKTRPGVDPRLEQHLLAALEAHAHVALDPARSEIVSRCRGGGVIAFERALALLARGDCDAIAVGGIDSYFDPDALEYLDRELRLHGPDTENGFIPGEAAAFVVLASRRRASAVYRYGQVISAASADEPRPYGSEEPCTALGITLAVKRAVEAIGPRARRVGWVLTDVANERHRVDEWSYAFARAHLALTEDVIHDQPLLRTGDVGAASAALLVAMAAVRWQTGCAARDCALIATHSDGPERGAMVVSAMGAA
jgi:3-oxoacyl-[acyl-carrier-protein] synthase I